MIEENIIMGWLITGGILSIAGFTIATYVHVGKVEKDADSKRCRIYNRLDEVKADAEKKFVDKDICQVLHAQMARDITEMKTDLKVLIKLRKGNGDG